MKREFFPCTIFVTFKCHCVERCLRYNCNNSFAVSQFCTVRRCVGGGVVEDKNMMVCSSPVDAIELLMAPLVVPHFYSISGTAR